MKKLELNASAWLPRRDKSAYHPTASGRAAFSSSVRPEDNWLSSPKGRADASFVPRSGAEDDTLQRRVVAATLGSLGLVALAGYARPAQARAEGSDRSERARLALDELPIRSVETIAALRALDPPDPGAPTFAAVLVQGYWRAGDGGGGLFYWSPSSVDPEDSPQAGLTILPGAAIAVGRWKRFFDGTCLNVRFFGAVGSPLEPDPSTDRKGIQAAFNACLGREVCIPAGVYLLDGELVLPQQGGRVSGEGRSATKLRLNGSPDGSNILSFVPASHEWLYVGNLTLDGGGLSNATGVRLHNDVGDIWSVVFHDMDIENLGIGVDSYGGPKNKAIVIVEFDHVTIRSRRFAMALHNSRACTLTHVVSDHVNNPQLGTESWDIWIEGDPASGGCNLDYVVSQAPYQNGIVIENFLQLWGNHITGDGAQERGIWVKNCRQIHLSHVFASDVGRPGCPWSTMSNSYGFGIVIENDTLRDSNATLVDCHAGNCITDGLYLKNVSGVAITNGTFLANGWKGWHSSGSSCPGYTYGISSIQGYGYGISIHSSLSVAVTGALIRSDLGSGDEGLSRVHNGILVEDSTNVSIVGCVLEGGRDNPGFNPQACRTNNERPSFTGITLTNSRYCVVSSNQIFVFERGLLENGTSDFNVLTGNVIAYNGGSTACGDVWTRSYSTHSIHTNNIL
jgi:hypothetical protein